MATRVTQEQIQIARKTWLGPFLLSRFPEEYKTSGRSVVSKTEKGFSAPLDFSGYQNFRTGDRGNPIDFMMKHKNYSFQDAVLELWRYNSAHAGEKPEVKSTFCLPQRYESTLQVRKYLSARAIPEWLTDRLILDSILYEDERHNAVFVSYDQDYCELRGTCGRKFHGSRKKERDGFWSMSKADDDFHDVYVCEGAIDALSLFLLSQETPELLFPETDGPAVFVSIGGTGNQSAIERLADKGYVILAVDNDPAGEECRQRNKNLASILPVHKDWNEDLMTKAGLKLDER